MFGDFVNGLAMSTIRMQCSARVPLQDQQFERADDEELSQGWSVWYPEREAIGGARPSCLDICD
jgi:hypothetical protein